MRWQQRSDYVERVQAELKSLPPNAEIAPAEVDEASLTAIREILRTQGKSITQAFLLRRVLKSDPAVKDYVLGFETSFLTVGDKGPETIKNLIAQPFPFPVFIVHLKTQPYNKFKKQIKRLQIAPIYSKGS
jgi:hypothetical protein